MESNPLDYQFAKQRVAEEPSIKVSHMEEDEYKHSFSEYDQ